MPVCHCFFRPCAPPCLAALLILEPRILLPHFHFSSFLLTTPLDFLKAQITPMGDASFRPCPPPCLAALLILEPKILCTVGSLQNIHVEARPLPRHSVPHLTLAITLAILALRKKNRLPVRVLDFLQNYEEIFLAESPIS